MPDDQHAAALPPSYFPLTRHDVDAQPLDDELVLYNPTDGAGYTVNGTGLFIWQRCDGTRRLDDIAAELATHYAIDAERALTEVRTFVTEMARAGLLASPETESGATGV